MEAVNMKQRLHFRVVIFFLLLHQSTEADDCASAVDSCNAQNLKWKSVPVGVATDAKIPDIQMTSSTKFNTSTPAYNGRLGYTTGSSWCSVTSDSSSYLQVDLGASYIILGVATQGDHKSSQWVQTYQIQTSKDGSSFNDYKQNNVAEVFPGNIDSDSIVQNPLFDGVVGQYVRIRPKSSFGSTTCMRTELYGVRQDTVCSKIFVGVASSASIPDHRFDASSYYSSSYLPSKARLRTAEAWEPKKDKSSGSWLHIDLGSLVYICAVATQGNPKTHVDEYAKKYQLRMSLDNVSWKYYKDDNGKEMDFPGNTNRDGIVTNTLTVPTKAKFLRFYPTDYENGYAAMRVEVYGAPLECSKPFGLEKNGNVGDIKVTASSSSDSSHDASDGRLYGDASWCSSTSSKSEYIQIDFGKMVTLTGIATQGHHTDDKWVKTYILKYSIDGRQWNDYREGGNSAKVFQGNSDKSSIVVRWLNHPTSVRYIRVYPQTWKNAICMRLELFGCPSPSTLKISELSNTNLQASSGKHVTLTCKVQEPLVHFIEWSIDGKDVTGRSAGMTRDATSVKSLLQVNYTNADVFKSTLCSKQEMTCRRNVVCKVKYTSSSGDSIQGAEVETKNLELPSTPTLESVSNILSKSAEIHWTIAIKETQARTNSFVIKFSSQSSSTTVRASMSPRKITGLSVCTDYDVSLKALSFLGEGSWSNTLKFRTKPDQSPSVRPTGVTATSETSQSILVRWQVPSGLRCPVNGYRINISTIQGGSGKYTVVNFGNTTFRTIQNLDKWTNYYITVEASNELGYGPGSVPVSQRTQEDAPSVPRNIKTTDIASDGSSGPRLKVSWDIPSALNAEYIRKYSLSLKSADGKAITITTNKTTAILDVHGGVKYTIAVWAFTVSNGPKAEKIVITEAYAPPAPTEGVISNINGSIPNVTLWKISAINGPISEILVSVENVQGGKKIRRAIKTSIPDCEAMASRAFKLDPSQRFFILGDGKTYGENKNKKLIGGKYKVYQCGVTRNKQKKSLYGKTVMIAEVQVPVDHDKSDPQSGNGPGGNNTPLVASLVVVFLIIIIVAIIVGVIFWRRRRSNQANDDLKLNNVDDIERENTNAIEGGDVPPHANAGYAPNGRDDGDADLYGNADAIRHQPIHVNKFSQYVIEKGDSLKADFKLLSSVQMFPWTIAKNPKNKPKNRYANIIAYDHSRVVLEDTSNGSDYVNASYIHGFDGTPKTYIATQGPNPVSVPDFWQMVWQENIKTIVMLTNLIEAGKVKCHQYWPDKKEAYGKFIVNLHRIDTMADYVVRVLIVSKDGETESRQVYHFQYTSWPDKGVPEHATSILGFRNKARLQYSSCDSTGPLLVHCSAGVGRTGAFLAVDAMLERVKKEKTIDILNYVQLMRENRCTMIQTEAQYVFVHRALQEAITCGNTEIPVLNLTIAMGKLARPRPKDQQTGYHLEWKRLTAISPKVTNEVSKAGRQPNNRPRNRYQDIVPFDSARVFLAQDHQNYINASFANAFRERNAFIMTQAPLENTVSDFWLMVHQYKIGSIVMLNRLQEEDESFFQYWPKESSETYNGITVEVINRATKGPLVVTNCILTLVEDQNNPHNFVHIQHTDWPKDGAPSDCQSILDIVDRVQKAQQQSCNAPIAVQCSDGVGRSGTFCAVYSILERVKSEQVVDVFQAIKVLRLGRPNAVATLEQYKFCYKMVQVYLDSFNDYANFSEV